MKAPEGNFVSHYLKDFPDLAFLLHDAPHTTPIRLNTYIKSAGSYARQAQRVAERGSNANVIAVLLGKNAVVLVERTTEHSGMALPSGSVETNLHESFFEAFLRESKEETGASIDPESMSLLDVEIRRLVHEDTGDSQHVIVGTVVGNLATDAMVTLTPDAQTEGLRSVSIYPLDDIPALIFSDEAKIDAAIYSQTCAA